MALLLTVGKHATVPFEPEKMGIQVYSLEELCFYIGDHASLMGSSFMSQELIQWISEECGCEDLGKELSKSLSYQNNLASFVGKILAYVGFYSREKDAMIETVVAKYSNMDPFHKRKARADALLEKEKYTMAQREYGELLEILPPGEKLLQGEVYQCLGICMGRLFFFEGAAGYFKRAYELTGKEEGRRQYLFCMRYSMTEEQFLDFLEKNPGAYAEGVALENELDTLRGQWQDTEGYLELKTGQQKRNQGRFLEYQDWYLERLQNEQKSYRQMVHRGRTVTEEA